MTFKRQLNNLKWWLILTFPSKWGSRHIASLFEEPPFNDCLFDYNEVYVSPCSLRTLNDMRLVNTGLVRMQKPDFGGYKKTGREYVPYIGWLTGPMPENDDKGYHEDQ